MRSSSTNSARLPLDEWIQPIHLNKVWCVVGALFRWETEEDSREPDKSVAIKAEFIKAHVAQSSQWLCCLQFAPSSHYLHMSHYIQAYLQSCKNKKMVEESGRGAGMMLWMKKQAGCGWVLTEMTKSSMCAATVYLKAGQRDDDTEGCDSATPTTAKSKSPPVNQ